MSFRLPTAGHPARELMGDMAHVAEVLNPANVGKLSDFTTAVRNTRKQVAESNGLVKSVAVICLRADDERWLISVGPRGGWKKLWNFGTGRD